MNHKERITLDMSFVDCVIELSDGNPGAVKAMMELANQTAVIDPDCVWGSFGPLLSLDSNGIYGSRIWKLCRDVCNHDVVKTLAVLRAVQLGILNRGTLDYGIDNFGSGIDCDELLNEVMKQLPNFNRENKVEEVNSEHT